MIQLDQDISGVQISQVEVLPPPTSLSQLSIAPLVIQNPVVDAFKSVQKSTLQPGFSIRAIPVSDKNTAHEILEIEEVQIPSGYVHLDDVSDWTVFNYNRSYFATDADFKPLPGEENLPMQHRFDVSIQKRKFKVKYTKPITSVRIFYRRISENALDFEWAFWKTLVSNLENTNSEISTSSEFDLDGEFIFRAVPYVGDYPVGGYKEYKVLYEEDPDMQWNYVQISPNSYLVRIEGIVSEKVNFLEVRENGVLLGQSKIIRKADGTTLTTLQLTNTSSEPILRLEYKFFRKKNAFKSLVETRYDTVEKNYAIEPISLSVEKLTETKFKVNIQDSKNLLYSPPSEIEPFSGTSWTRAIQQGKIICKLIINRHQAGQVVSYGSYIVNVSQEKSPKFLEKPPFSDEIVKIERGFEFEFEDTQEFRSAKQLDNPDLGIPLAYEFRLTFWSAGVEDCLRTGRSYSFIKEDSITVKNKRRSYKRAYDTWREEHPRRKYTRVIPVDPEFAFLEHHLRYGSSPNGFLMIAEALPIRRTRNIEMHPGSWKVLYYYNDKDDEIQEFPYYCFNIDIPETSIIEIERLELYCSIPDPKTPATKIGEYHPSQRIYIEDFLSYFQMMLSVNSKIDLEKITRPLTDVIAPNKEFGFSEVKESAGRSLSNSSKALISTFQRNQFESSRPSGPVEKEPSGFQNFSRNTTFSAAPTAPSVPSSPSLSTGDLPSMTVNTPAKALEAAISNTSINNSISAQVKNMNVQYRVDITYRDGKTSSVTMSASVSDRPTIPEDPEGNSSISIGNKVFSESIIQVPSAAAAVITDSIAKTPVGVSNFSTSRSPGSDVNTSVPGFSISTATGVYST